MKKNKSSRTSSFALMILMAFFSTAFAQEMQRENNEAPVLDYDTEIQKTVSKERHEKKKRFNDACSLFGSGRTVITELPKGVEPLPTITHWWIGLPALPFEQSTAIVLGEVIQAEAHLSDNKTGIYSEFLIKIEEVFKDTSKLVRLKNTVSANRCGGSVRFASGRVNKYRTHREGMPQKGERYLLFLKQSESEDFFILTGYKLSEGKVMPLDGEDSKDPRAALAFAKYRETGEIRLLQDLRTSLGY